MRRLSGTEDLINVLARQELLEALELAEGRKLCLSGELRSFNNRHGEGARLVITAFARQLSLCGGEDENRPPLGRDICDLMLAVNRPYGRSDYLPCICWGGLARQAARWEVGERLRLEGRVQSRRYIKLTEDGPAERTAYEVSVLTAENGP